MATLDVDVVLFDIGATLVGDDRSWIPGAKELLDALKGAGFRIGLISNTGDLDRDGLAALLPADFDFALFEDALILLSKEVGIAKPDIRIFLEAARRAAASPWRCVFVGENLLETAAAQRAGLHALRVSPDGGDLGRLMEVLT